MAIFVNYDGPKLDTEQKRVVRSRAMVVVRGRRKQAKSPARDDSSSGNSSHSGSPEDDAQHAQQALAVSSRPVANSSRKRDNLKPWMAVAGQSQRAAPNLHLNPYDLRGAPPRSTHMTGVDARTFQDYLSRCGSYSSYLDEAFVLVGFRQPSYFRPDLSKAACIYIGWLLTAGVLDAFRGTREIAYPYYEYQAVRELQKFVDGADERQLHEVVYPVLILGMFEMVRFSPRTITHLAAVEGFIKSRGGLRMMPDVMQHLVLMADTLQCVCLGTPLAFNVLAPTPTLRLTTADGFPAGNQLRSCPLLLCDAEDLSLAGQYADTAVRARLVDVLQAAHDAFRHFFFDPAGAQSTLGECGLDLDTVANSMGSSAAAANSVPHRLLETCALAARITRNTLSGEVDGFDDAGNALDVQLIYEHTRFMGLKAWTGLPYVYVWVNLIGFAASTEARMRSYFVAEVVRCAFSYGCYQMEVFQAVLRNFLHLRNAIAGRKTVLAAYAAGELGLF
ncbi:hypothetical protein C8A01DRAFT_31713 [Parachaetomium inaequale]|uniref:Uncharacterized protein n=1 Tax=Parachaetomium inaequale TaxID=2588326 RepID=A0AAN6PRT0_9PEZI|nr:hypothetical protein C8A01DRAFT_31713 [Parachaetomium inaequale]